MTEDVTARASEDGDVAMAHAVQEKLEESGARARLKEWLYDALEIAGWTADMDKQASEHVEDRARNSSDADPPPSVAQIASHIMQKGFGTSLLWAALDHS